MSRGAIRFVGVSALAREVGRTQPTVSHWLRKGKTPDEIRAFCRQIDLQRAAGIPTVGGRHNLGKRKEGKRYVSEAGSGSGSGSGVGSGSDSQPLTYTPARRIPVSPATSSAPVGLTIASPHPAGKTAVVVSGVPGQVPAPTPVRERPVVSDQTQQTVEDLAAAQLRKESALASLREEELKQKRGELAPLIMVNAYICGMIVKARDILMRIAPELRDWLAATSDPVEIEKRLDAEIRRALGELKEMNTI